ncbi:hypothetical protein [Flagellimonas flava]|uniref:hypothetical protein n=1 Tax=Flagellimonas flava TaxID=570519 RepID=UPI003D65160B
MKSKVLSLCFVVLFAISNAQEREVVLEKGMIVSFIASSFHNQESQQNASAYFEKVFPLAQQYSFKPLVQFNTIQVVERHFMASVLGMYSWDSQKQFDGFHNEKSWPELKATRPLYWKNLRSVHIKIRDAKTLRFSTDKVYRITYIWLHDFKHSGENLHKYLIPMRKVIHRLGGRLVVGFDSREIASMSSLNNDRIPDRIAITEWPNENTHQQYIASPEFKEYSKFFFSSVAEFEAFDTKIVTQ